MFSSIPNRQKLGEIDDRERNTGNLSEIKHQFIKSKLKIHTST